MYEISVSKYDKVTKQYSGAKVITKCNNWGQVLYELENINIKYYGEQVSINNIDEDCD